MKATQEEIKLPTQNDAIFAKTLGRIYEIVLKPGALAFPANVLNSVKMHELMLHLLAAPEDLLPSC
jgi:hypothetical protein